ncbi:MAG TPA: MFS transporter [Chloroflexota bacterium]|nr:MFS transporter [Chloroflexota bacterium]
MGLARQLGHRTFSSLKIRNYRLYFTGQAISLSGTWMQSIGQAWLVLQLTGSGTALGTVTAMQFLPILLFGPWGGVIADRYPKQKILYVTQSAAGVLALALGVLVATGRVQLWMVYGLALGLGLVNTIDNPTRQTFVVEMVGQDALPNAVALNSAEINLARVVGPAIGGAIIAALGLASCFILNGLSYAAVLVVLCMMRPSELRPAPLVRRARGQVLEGLRYVRSSRVLLTTLVMMTIIGMLAYEFSVSLPLLAEFTFGGNASSYAALTASMGLGSVIGGVFIASRRHVGPQMLAGAALLFGLVILGAAVAPNLPLAMAALVLVGIFSINFTSLGNVTMQLTSPPAMRGRVMALWTVAVMGSTPIGGPIIGWVGEHVGPRWALGVGGVAAIVAAGLGAWMLRELTRAPAEEATTRPVGEPLADREPAEHAA